MAAQAGGGADRSGRSALIVASNEYQDPGLTELRAPSADAEALAAVLSDPEIGGFEVVTLTNQPAHLVNEAVEEFFADRHPDDLLLVHFSCHGIKDQAGELYFAMSNTRLRLLGATSVAANFVNRRMTESRSRRIVLLLDCCYAGAFERGMVTRATGLLDLEERFTGRGRAVITASGALEYAFEGGELTATGDPAPSVFTAAMVRGLGTGEADRDRDGYVDLDELYDYVYDAVREVTPHQTPGKWTYGVQGDLMIARSKVGPTLPAAESPPARAVAPAPPADARRTPWTRRRATLVTLAALVLAVVVGGGAWLLLEDQPDDDGSPPNTPTPTGDAPIPAAFDGQWRGTGEIHDDDDTSTQFTAELREGLTSGRLEGEASSCMEGALVVKTATDDRLTTRFLPDEDGCTPWAVVFTPSGSRLHMAVDPDSGTDRFQNEFAIDLARTVPRG
jgi:hypothetical protein